MYVFSSRKEAGNHTAKCPLIANERSSSTPRSTCSTCSIVPFLNPNSVSGSLLLYRYFIVIDVRSSLGGIDLSSRSLAVLGQSKRLSSSDPPFRYSFPPKPGSVVVVVRVSPFFFFFFFFFSFFSLDCRSSPRLPSFVPRVEFDWRAHFMPSGS